MPVVELHAERALDTRAPDPVASLSAPRLATIALVTAQLVLTLLVVRQFRIESRTFFEVLVLATAGFVVHALLPMRHRLAFFVLLSVGSIVVALGLRDGGFVLLLGLVLIAVCHLPVGLPLRVALLVGIGALFAVFRAGALPGPWSMAIWPVLGSMFMFRLAVYLYALRYEAKRPTPAQAFAYFFMLPNVCFPLYPVVDYATFVRSYYDREPLSIYETGVKWIVRGLVHLILYRFVYLYLAGDPAELASLGDLVKFLLATYLLYLRVSGQFHVIAGVLHLFGFRLPETHHLYYLASSFTDFWRRINIYWKDFMMKLVYYPSFFGLRRFGGSVALAAATAIVFVVTWLLHSYQWFWLRGSFPLAPQDAVFWAVLGAFVVRGSLREMKSPRKRRLGPASFWSASLALRTVRFFAVICVLWSLWSAQSVSAWLTMWIVAGNVGAGDLWLLAGLLAFGLLIAGHEWSVREDDGKHRPVLLRPAFQSTAVLGGLLLLGDTQAYARQGPRLAATVESLQRSTLNARDEALQHKGYYENLDNTSRMSAQLWDVQAGKPAHWVGLSSTAAFRRRADFLRDDLTPGARITFLDQPLTVNRFGMRDRETTREKPAGTYRIALLGPSHVMGSGVADGETFADVLEERLNQSAPPSSPRRYEVLNFGVAGYSLLQQLALLDERVFDFQPDAVFITDSPRAEEPIVGQLCLQVYDHTEIPYPTLNALLRETGVTALGAPGLAVPYESARSLLAAAGVKTRMPWTEAEHRLRMKGDALVAWALAEIAATLRRHDVRPVFVALDNVVEPLPKGKALARQAERAGFLVFDLNELWVGRDLDSLRIVSGDNHPNAAATRLIAERLLELVRQHAVELRIAAAASEPVSVKEAVR
jgi:hypothetical protein